MFVLVFSLRQKVPRLLVFFVLFVVVFAAWMSFEVAARRSLMADIIRVYRDPDHRLGPNDERAGTNSDGLRSAIEAAELPEEGVTVFFLGDSFVFGVQVERERALPQRFEAGLRQVFPDRTINVVNAAWESASPLLALRLLQDLGPKYRPDIVVYGFDMTDFRDDLMYRNLLHRRGLYRMAGFAPATLRLLNQGVKAFQSDNLYRWMFKMPADRFFAVNRPLAETRPDMEASWLNLVALNEYCVTALAADFYLVVLPRNFQYSDRESPVSWEKGEYENLGEHVLAPFRFFGEKADSAPFAMSSLLPAFRDTPVYPTCFAGDPHWTPAGTEVAAQALVEIAVGQGWLDQLD